MPPDPTQDRSFHVRPSNDGVPLSTALRKMLGDDHSWSDVKRLVATRHVTVNGNLCLDDARPVKTGDVVHVFAHSRAPLPTEADLRLRYLDEHLVVIEKPPGLNTLRHREETDLPQKRKDKAPTVEELLQKLINQKWHAGSLTPAVSQTRRSTPPPPQSRNAPPAHPLFGKKSTKHETRNPKARPHHPNPQSAIRNPQSTHPTPSRPPVLRPVHRLDRDTSGLMLFALSPQAEQALERDFARHIVTRVYHALVHGHVTAPRTIDTYLIRDRGDGLRGSSPKGQSAEGAQRAITHLKPLERLGTPPHTYTLIECQLETGRTHQIRIHLSELGHPLAGEKIYTPPPTDTPHPTSDTPHPTSDTPHPTSPTLPPPSRHALHSAHLRFTHPITHEQLEFHSDLPKDLAVWLKKLRALP